jgi:hypothetical protein
VLPFFILKTCVLRVIRGRCGSSRAVLAANVSVMRLSSISGGRKLASLYRAAACACKHNFFQ